MSIESNDLDAAFSAVMCRIRKMPGKEYGESHLRYAYLAGLSDGVDKAASVYRGSALASDPAAILERIDASPTLLRRIHEDAGKVDVQA